MACQARLGRGGGWRWVVGYQLYLKIVKRVILKTWGNSLVLHCASLLRTIFASLARANERVHVHNVRDFSQDRLNSEISARFLLNEHADQYILFHDFNENSILNNWENN